MKKTWMIGDRNASFCLLQAVDDHDAAFLESEYDMIREFSNEKRILLAAFQTDSWNGCLSPWEAPPVFGKEAFGGKAGDTLRYVLETFLPGIRQILRNPDETKYVIGGYSLAGLFALWASYQTDVFCGCAAASPSVWFPGWTGYARDHTIRTKHVYLSLGDREERTKNPQMRTVGDCIRTQKELLADTDSILEWNPGNHFADADKRTARAFAWCVRAAMEEEKTDE